MNSNRFGLLLVDRGAHPVSIPCAERFDARELREYTVAWSVNRLAELEIVAVAVNQRDLAAERWCCGAKVRIERGRRGRRPLEGRRSFLWICLPDGDDDDVLTDGCVRFASIRDTSAEPTGFMSDDAIRARTLLAAVMALSLSGCGDSGITSTRK